MKYYILIVAMAYFNIGLNHALFVLFAFMQFICTHSIENLLSLHKCSIREVREAPRENDFDTQISQPLCNAGYLIAQPFHSF